MNTRKMTLNEELSRMKQLFGHMGIPSKLITEGVSDTGLQILKGLETGSSVSIALPRASEAMRLGFIENLSQKGINSLEEMKTRFGGTMEQAASAFLKTLPQAEQTALLSKFSTVASEENIAALTGLNKLPNVETKLKELGNSTLSILEKRKTQGISTLTSSEIKVIESNLKFMEENAAGNTKITNLVNGVKAEVDLIQNPINTTDLTTDLTTEYKGDAVTLPIANKDGTTLDYNKLDDYASLSSTSWSIYKPDFSKMVGEGITDLESFNLKMAQGLEKIKNGDLTGWDYIPEKGFEDQGCENWKNFLKEKYEKKEITIVGAIIFESAGHWKITNLNAGNSKKLQSLTTNNKSLKTFYNIDLGTKNMSVYKVEIVPEDFNVVPGELLRITQEVISNRLNWINSPEYRERRKNLTGESDNEIDSGIIHIMNNITNNLRIEFYKNENATWWGVVNNKPHTIEIQPREILEDIKGTLDHEVDHYMSLLLYGSISQKTLDTLNIKFKDLFLKIGDPIIDLVPYLRKFWEVISGYSTPQNSAFRSYVFENIEQQARLNRLNLYFKNKYNLSTNSKLTFGQTESLWREYLNWKKNGIPPGLDDVYYLLNAYDKTNPTIFLTPKSYEKTMKNLQNILNAVFSITALFTLNELYE